MPDHAKSTHPAVQAQLDRLWSLSPGADILGLSRISELLRRLGNPHHDLPPVFHVAGTNGKGSTCTFLRAMLEASGRTIHAYTSPHLVRFNERIRIAGQLIEDDALATLLARVLDVAEGIGASFFEVTTAAAFLAFSETPADACVIEVGLGGRLDATNVLPRPLVTGIAALGIDHQAFLGSTLPEIAREKAGIAKAGVPLVTMRYPAFIAAEIARVAEAADAPVIAQGDAWNCETASGEFRYRDAGFTYRGERPAMAGTHQSDNLALAIAMMRQQTRFPVDAATIRAAAANARWPARMQRLSDGPLTRRLGQPGDPFYGVWLDGAHNPSAAAPVGDWWSRVANGMPTAIVLGLLANKDADGVIAALTDQAAPTMIAVPVPGHDHHHPDALVQIARTHGVDDAFTAASVSDALDLIRARGSCHSVLIAGSLYLAGEVLAANDELPE